MTFIWLIIWLLSSTPPLTGGVLIGLSVWGVVMFICLILDIISHGS